MRAKPDHRHLAAHSAAEVACLPCVSTVATPASPERTALVFSVHAVASNVTVVPGSGENAASPLQAQLSWVLSSKMQHWMFDDTEAPGGAHWAAEVAGLPCCVIVSVLPLSGNETVLTIVHDDLVKVTVTFGSSADCAVESLPQTQATGPASPASSPSSKAQQVPSPDEVELEEEQATRARIDAKSVMASIRMRFEDTRLPGSSG